MTWKSFLARLRRLLFPPLSSQPKMHRPEKRRPTLLDFESLEYRASMGDTVGMAAPTLLGLGLGVYAANVALASARAESRPSELVERPEHAPGAVVPEVADAPIGLAPGTRAQSEPWLYAGQNDQNFDGGRVAFLNGDTPWLDPEIGGADAGEPPLVPRLDGPEIGAKDSEAESGGGGPEKPTGVGSYSSAGTGQDAGTPTETGAAETLPVGSFFSAAPVQAGNNPLAALLLGSQQTQGLKREGLPHGLPQSGP